MPRSQQVWEMRLGVWQAIVLLIVLFLALLCAFYLGLFSGRNVGYEDALASHSSQLARLPVVAETVLDDLEETATSEVYSKLKETAVGQRGDLAKQPAKEHKLASIKTTDLAPVADELIPLPEEQEASQADSGGESDLKKPDETNKALANNRFDSADQGDSLKGRADLLFQEERAKPAGPNLGSLLQTDPRPERLHVVDSLQEERGVDKNIPADRTAAAETTEIVTGRLTGDGGFVRQSSESDQKSPEQPKPDPTVPLQARESESSFVKETLTAGWFAQLAAPRELADANALAKQLRASGFPVVIEKTTVRGEQYYRVLCGPEEKREHAEILINQLKRESFITVEPFLRRVN